MSNKRKVKKKLFSNADEQPLNKKVETGENYQKENSFVNITVKKKKGKKEEELNEEEEGESRKEIILKMEEEVNSLKAELESSKVDYINELKEINSEIDVKNKELTKENKTNMALINQLKSMEKEFGKKYNKYMSKNLGKKKFQLKPNSNDIEKIIKATEKEKKIMERIAENSKLEKDRVENLLNEVDNGLESDYNKEIEELKTKTNRKRNEIEKINKSLSSHERCNKEIQMLNNKVNILNIEIEYELKKSKMIKFQIEEKNRNIDNEILEENSGKNNYKRETVKLYNGPNELVNRRMNYGTEIKNEVIRKAPPPVRVNKSFFKYIENELYSPIKVKKKTNKKLDGNPRKDIKSLIDNAPLTESNLFNKKEDEVIRKFLPENYFNRYKEMFDEKKREKEEIEKKFSENDEIKDQNELINYRIEASKMELIGIARKKENLMLKISKNNIKIREFESLVKDYKKYLNQQEILLKRLDKKNKKYQEIIQKFNQSKVQQ